MKEIKFNINEMVRVRLTDYGRKIDRERFEKIKADTGHSLSYKPKKESDGWSRWQMWVLMETFGEHCTWGELPFETNIILEIPDRLGDSYE